jgi:hypothetical protein
VIILVTFELSRIAHVWVGQYYKMVTAAAYLSYCRLTQSYTQQNIYVDSTVTLLR